MTYPAWLMSGRLWSSITALGDSAVLLPCIALIVLWLAIPRLTRGLAWRWLLWILVVVTVVGVSKLAFMGWMVSFPGLDFTGFSGHTTLATMVWPALGALIGRRRGPLVQGMGVVLGLLLAIAIGLSRLVLHAHSPSEVVLAWLLGGAAGLAFLWRYRASWCLPERLYVAALSMILVVPLVYGDRFPSQAILSGIARHWSGHPAYTRVDLVQFRQMQRS